MMINKPKAKTKDVFDKAIEMLQKESVAADATEKLVLEARSKMTEIEARYAELRLRYPDENLDPMPSADIPGRIADVVRRRGPMLSKYFGWPGAAVGSMALLADDGAFTGIIKKVVGIFGGPEIP
jgi:hypothetical protein